MEKNSFVSFSGYFGELRHKAREIDEGIDKLAETWKMPHLLVGGYAERTVETDACLDELWKSFQDTSVSPTGDYYYSMLRNAGQFFLHAK